MKISLANFFFIESKEITFKDLGFPETALGKNGPIGAAIAQFIGFRFQVSGVREPR